MKRPKYKPPNRALDPADFEMPSAWEHWTLSLETWYGLKSLKNEVRIGGGMLGALLLLLLSALVAKVYELL